MYQRRYNTVSKSAIRRLARNGIYVPMCTSRQRNSGWEMVDEVINESPTWCCALNPNSTTGFSSAGPVGVSDRH